MTTKKVLLMTEKPLGLSCLRYLETLSEVDLVGVCTRQPADVWWGDQVVRQYCEQQGIPLIRREDILNYEVDILISVLYPFIIEPYILAHARDIAVNLHEAPLPRWKGCNGYSHAIIEGDKQYATTFHVMDAKLDAGATLKAVSFPILENETSKELYERTRNVSFELFKEMVPVLLGGDYSVQESEISDVEPPNTRSSLLSSKEMMLTSSCHDVFAIARALDFLPWEPAYVMLGDTKWYVFINGSCGRVVLKSQFHTTWDHIVSTGHLEAGVWEIDGFPRSVLCCDEKTYKQVFPLRR